MRQRAGVSLREPADITRTIYIMTYTFENMAGERVTKDIYGLCYDFKKVKSYLENKYNLELDRFVECQARSEVRSLDFNKFMEVSKLESMEVMA